MLQEGIGIQILISYFLISYNEFHLPVNCCVLEFSEWLNLGYTQLEVVRSWSARLANNWKTEGAGLHINDGFRQVV